MGRTWGTEFKNRLFKLKIRMSRGQKGQKQTKCHFFRLETDFENILVISRICQDSTNLVFLNSTLPKLSRRNNFG